MKKEYLDLVELKKQGYEVFRDELHRLCVKSSRITEPLNLLSKSTKTKELINLMLRIGKLTNCEFEI